MIRSAIKTLVLLVVPVVCGAVFFYAVYSAVCYRVDSQRRPEQSAATTSPAGEPGQPGAGPGAYSPALAERAARDLAAALVEALPEEVHMRLLAVGDFKGDDGTLYRNVLTALKEKTNFVVIERRELDTLLREQGMQLSDLVDLDTRIEHGRIKGVEGLLFGEVLERRSRFMSLAVKAHAQLDNVESGEIVYSGSFAGAAASPLRDLVLALVSVVIFAVYIRLWMAKRSVNRTAGRIGDDIRLRKDAVHQLEKSIRNVSDAQGKLSAGDTAELAGQLRALKDELLHLRQAIDLAPAGDTGLHSPRDIRNNVRFDEKFTDSVAGIAGASARLYALVDGGDPAKLTAEIRGMQAAVNNALTRMESRPLH